MSAQDIIQEAISDLGALGIIVLVFLFFVLLAFIFWLFFRKDG